MCAYEEAPSGALILLSPVAAAKEPAQEAPCMALQSTSAADWPAPSILLPAALHLVHSGSIAASVAHLALQAFSLHGPSIPIRPHGQCVTGL